MLTIELIDFERKYRDTIRKLWPILTRLHTLRIEKEFDDQQIQETINKMELPLRYHLFITGHFTKLMDVVETRGRKS